MDRRDRRRGAPWMGGAGHSARGGARLRQGQRMRDGWRNAGRDRRSRSRAGRGAALIVDYHMHLRDEREQLAHRASAVEPFVECARRAGVDEIGFTEHVYYFEQTRPLWTVPYHLERCAHDLDDY